MSSIDFTTRLRLNDRRWAGLGGSLLGPVWLLVWASACLGDDTVWKEVGPSPLLGLNAIDCLSFQPMSGQVSSIAVDLVHDPTGNTVFVGSSSGGLWKSTNGLSPSPRFVLLSDQTKSLSVGAVALDTTKNPPVIVVGTGAPDNAGNVASYTGTGILTSTDAGRTWTSVESADGGAHPFTGLGFSNIIVDPRNPNVLVASTGVGSDPNFPPSAFPQGSHAFAHIGLYRSQNGGNSWTQVKAFPLPGCDVGPCNLGGFFHIDLIYEPTRAMYIAGVSKQGLFCSGDGANWRACGGLAGFPPATTIERASLATRDGKVWALLLVDVSGGTGFQFQLLELNANGLSWRALPLPPINQKGFLMYVAAPPSFNTPNYNTLLVATDSLYRTDNIQDSSPTWNPIENNLHGDQHAIAFASRDRWYVGDDGGAWATTNGGQSWTSLNIDLHTGEFYSVAADWAGSALYAGGLQDNNPAINVNVPAWQTTIRPMDHCGGDGLYVASIPDDPQAFFLSFQWGSLTYAKVGSNGVSLSPALMGFSEKPWEHTGFATPYEVLPNDPRLYAGVKTPLPFDFAASRIALVGTRNPLLLAFNPSVEINPQYGPIQITSQINQFIGYIASVPGDPTTAYLTAGGYNRPTALYRVSNISFAGNATFSQILNPDAGGGPLNGDVLGPIAFAPSRPNVLYLAKAGFKEGDHLWKTTNGGETWVNISGNLPNKPVNWVAIDPDDGDAVYVATSVGVFQAADGGIEGERWQVPGTGLPNVPVMQLRVTRTRKLIAATFGRGVWGLDLPAPTNWVSRSLQKPIPLPFDAVLAGRETKFGSAGGAPLYVCRGGTVEGYALQPGRFRSDMSGCDIGFGGRDIQVPDFDFLVTSWEWASYGNVPLNAVAGGEESPPPGSLTGPTLHYCRAILSNQSGWQLGKIRPGFDGCYIPFGGQEIHAMAYQVLVASSPAMPLTNISAANGNVPPDAIRAGTDIDGAALYICSAYAHGGTHPGKLRPEFGGCDVSWGGHEEFIANYQVLAPSWLPPSALLKLDFPAGYDVNGKPLYVCRAYVGLFEGAGVYPGKYRPEFGACSFALDGQEHWSTTFDVLSSLSPR